MDKKPVLPPMPEKKPEFPTPKAALDEEPKKEEPKPEEKPEEKKEAAQEPTKEETKSERETQLEAELQAERTKSAIREKTLTARALVEEMFERGLISPDEDTVKRAQAEGESVFDSKRKGLVKAIDEQMSDLFRMDESAFKSFAKSIRGLKKEAAKKGNVLGQVPVLPVDPLKMGKTDEEWLRELPWS
jgi:primosomal protein N'